MEIYLCARDKEQVAAWKLFCGMYNFVTPTVQDILHIKAEGLVGPGNSFGNMTGGIDLHYVNYFGKAMESEIKRKIFDDFNGELLVGQATNAAITHPSYAYKTLVYAPTMRVPMVVSHTINPYLATKAALQEALRLGLDSITFPGMGTGTGCVAPNDCAKQMGAAIEDVLVNPSTEYKEVYEEQQYMYSKLVNQRWLAIQFSGEEGV